MTLHGTFMGYTLVFHDDMTLEPQFGGKQPIHHQLGHQMVAIFS